MGRSAGEAVGKDCGNARTVREGGSVTVYTVGYERRDGDELFALLLDHGVKALADIRERPMSRKPEFRGAALRARCLDAGIEYQPWPGLGSTPEQREALTASGDFGQFAKQFRELARRAMGADLQRLATSVAHKPTALLCYERCHDECHRSIVADIIAEKVNATVIAL